jgi:hypothetical protein
MVEKKQTLLIFLEGEKDGEIEDVGHCGRRVLSKTILIKFGLVSTWSVRWVNISNPHGQKS